MRRGKCGRLFESGKNSDSIMIMNVNSKTTRLTVVSGPEAEQRMVNGWEARMWEILICLLPSTSQTRNNNTNNEDDVKMFILCGIGVREAET